MKYLLVLLLLIPSLSLSWESASHKKFKNQIEYKFRSEGYYERSDIEKIPHQSQLDRIEKEKEYCANAIKRNKDLLISQNLDPDMFSSGKHSCEEQLEFTMKLYERSERLRIEKITTNILHSEIIKLNNQRLKSNNKIEIKELNLKIEELLKQYTIYVYGKETKMNDCFISGEGCSSVASVTSNNSAKDKKIDFSSIYLNNQNNGYNFLEQENPKIDYVPSSSFNMLPDVSNSYLGKPVHTDGTNFYDSYGNIVNQDSYGNSYGVDDIVCTLSYCK